VTSKERAMTGRRLALIGLLSLTTLVAVPRPAHAQWIDFMKWLESLDPEKFHGYDLTIPIVCNQRDASGARLTWNANAPCDMRSSRETKQYFAVREGQAWGTSGALTFANPAADKRISLFQLSGSYNYTVGRSLHVGIGAGWARFGGAGGHGRLVHRLTVEPQVRFFPAALFKNIKPEARWVQGFYTGFSWVGFPQGFTPQDFGAVSGSASMDGSAEWITTWSMIGYAIRY
jgi:hypothetical protein